MSTRWRPNPVIRPVAIGIVRRGEELLVEPVHDDAGGVLGWRPLGGGIEFGERAEDALRREFMEEAGLAIAEPTLLTVVENIYEHYGVRGHEVAFVFETAFAEAKAYEREVFGFQDGDGIACEGRWVDIGCFRGGAQRLFPAGLIDRL